MITPRPPSACGAKAGPFAFIKPPRGHQEKWCVAHDADYRAGGTWRDKFTADWKLLRGMLSDATGRLWWQRPAFRAKAVAFWVAVTLGGWFSFHFRAVKKV